MKLSLLVSLSLLLICLPINAQGIFWEKLSAQPPGIPSNLFYSKDTLVFVVAAGLYRSRDNGNSWEPTASINLQFIQFGVTPNGTLLHTGSDIGNYRMERSTDDGDTWQLNFSTFDSYISYASDSVKTFAGQYKGNEGCMLSYDNGINWQDVGNGLPYFISSHETYYLVHSLLLKDNLIFAGTWDGIYKADTVNYSWQATTVREGIVNMLVHPDGTLIGFSSSPDLLYLSYDNGTSWSSTSIPGEVGYRGITITQQGYLICGQRLGASPSLYISYNKGNSWYTSNAGLPSPRPAIHVVKCDSRNFVWVGTDSGLYRSSEPIPTNVEIQSGGLPSNYNLQQNYPNPFNPSTKIKYTIPSVTLRQAQSDIFVTLKVYDVLGNEIAILINEEKPTGEYEAEFKGIGLPSGIYFYQLRAGDFVESKKMVLLK